MKNSLRPKKRNLKEGVLGELSSIPTVGEILDKLMEIQRNIENDGEVDTDVMLVIKNGQWEIVAGVTDMSRPGAITSATITIDDTVSELAEISKDILWELDGSSEDEEGELDVDRFREDDVTDVYNNEDEVDAALDDDFDEEFDESRKPPSPPDAHQLKICRDTIKNPLKGKFLGGPSAKEAEKILRTKFGYTDAQIAKLKESRKPMKESEIKSEEDSMEKSVDTNVLLTEILPSIISLRDLEEFNLEGTVFEKIDGSEVIDGVEVLSAIFTEFPPDLIEKITVASEITKFTGINLETIQKFLVDTKARHEAFTVEDAKGDIQSDDKFYELLKLAISDNKITVSISDFINSAGEEEDAEVATTEEEQPQTDETTEEPKEEPTEEESTEEPQEEPKEEIEDDEEEVKESKVYIIVNTEGKTFNLVTEEFGRRCKDSVIESIHRLPYSLPNASVRVDEGTTISYFESELSDKPVATVKSFSPKREK